MDYLVNIKPHGYDLKVYGVTIKNSLDDIRKLQQLSPIATAALGRALSAVALLSGDLKMGRVMLQITGDGPLKEILAEADYRGNIRGLVRNPNVILPLKNDKLPVGDAIGKNGFLVVTKDYGLRDFYQGSTELVSGEIAEDIAYYLNVSEQIPSACALGVFVGRDLDVQVSAGFLIQKLPTTPQEQLVDIEEKLKSMPSLTSILKDGKSIEDYLTSLLGDITIRERREIRFKCTCDLQKIERTLVALGKDEINELINKNEPVEITCEFCRKKYHIDQDKLKAIYEHIQKRITT